MTRLKEALQEVALQMEPQRHSHQPPLKFDSTAVAVACRGRCSSAALTFAARWGANCFRLCSLGNSCIPCHIDQVENQFLS